MRTDSDLRAMYEIEKARNCMRKPCFMLVGPRKIEITCEDIHIIPTSTNTNVYTNENSRHVVHVDFLLSKEIKIMKQCFALAVRLFIAGV